MTGIAVYGGQITETDHGHPLLVLFPDRDSHAFAT